MAVFVAFWCLSGSLWVSFWHILGKFQVFLGKGVPSILNDSTTFWLDFEGLGHPETKINQEKAYSKILVFLVVGNTAPESYLSAFGLDFDVILEPKTAQKGQN